MGICLPVMVPFLPPVFLISPLWGWRCGPSHRKCEQFSSWSGNQWWLAHVGLQITCYQSGFILQKVHETIINAIEFCSLYFFFIIPVLFPNPSCPQSFLPQPNTPPDKERAKLCSPPAAIWTSGIRDIDRRCWGWLVQSSHCPTPSWPLEFLPHAYTWPAVEKQQWQVVGNYIVLDYHCDK